MTNAQGLLTFPNRRSSMKHGLYLAIGQQYSDGAYVYTTEPFLAALPVTDEASNTWVYDLTVSPKHTADEVTPPSDDTTERKVLKAATRPRVRRRSPSSFSKTVPSTTP